jgi:murein L,D-transpeptidase YcbB/YkuD
VSTPAPLPQGRVIAQRGLAATAAAALAAILSLPLSAIAADAGPATPATAGISTAALQPNETAPAAADIPAVPETELKKRLDTPGGLAVAGERLHTELLRRFYGSHNYKPVWTERQGQAEALRNALIRAGEHGLDPNLFHAAALSSTARLSPIDRDLLLSDAFLSFADALARGAVPLEARYDDEDLRPEPVDVAAELDRAIGSPDPAAAIERLAPQTQAYKALQRALQTVQHASVPGEQAAVAGAPARGQPGQQPRANPGSRQTVAANGDARLRQIAVNLERQRWLPRSMPADRVVVNTAAAQLVLYRSDRPAFTTRVVVGELDKQTPELQTTIDGVLFNPPWNVPPSIARSEILPKVASDPGYLARHNMVYRSNGAIQQLPGPHAALGQIKFEMPNRFDVYLHDTPMKALFSQDNRRRSHGCVRVQNPRELASLLLQEPVDAVNRGVSVGYTHRKSLSASVPVFFVYQTAFADADGTIEFRPDFYARDEAIWQRLHRTSQVPMAQHEPPGERRS